MDAITRTSILIAFVGLLCLMVGFTNRDRGWGLLVMWGGVTGMIGVIVHYILRALE